jgi:hypothetical protein
MFTKNNLHKAAMDAVFGKIRMNLGVTPGLAREDRRVWLEIEDAIAETVTIRVCAKQNPVWPRLIGIAQEHERIVLVDYEGSQDIKQCRFFVLDKPAWEQALDRRLKQHANEYPEHKFTVVNNTPVFSLQPGQKGGLFTGIDFHVVDVKEYENDWNHLRPRR